MATPPLPAASVRYSYYQLLDVANAAFPTNSQASIRIAGQTGFRIINYGPGDIEVSYDGTNVDGDLRFGTPSASLSYDVRIVQAVWIRVTSGGNAEVRLEAWSHT